jgi:molybdate transport system ATP-binding protein
VVQLADQLILLDQGHIQAQGPLATLLHTEIALQHEAMSVLHGMQTSAGGMPGICHIQLSNTHFELPVPLLPITDFSPPTMPCRLRVRARDVSVSLKPLEQSSIQIQLPACISHWHATAHPAILLLILTLSDGQQLAAQISQRAFRQLALTTGSELWANIKAAALH